MIRFMLDITMFNIMYLIFFSNLTIYMPLIILVSMLFMSFFFSNKIIKMKKTIFMLNLIVFFLYSMLFFLYSSNLYPLPLFFVNMCSFTTFNMNFTLGLDNMNLLFTMLVSFMFSICFLMNWNYNMKNFLLYSSMSMLLEFLLILSFTTYNFFFFFFFFEACLIPMYFMMLMWGSRQSKFHANYYFFLYTMFGSALLFTGMMILLSTCGTLDINVLSTVYMSCDSQILMWLFLFFGFVTKLPLPPFHMWLPEAHVEASSAGSIMLAAILLKLGSYGMFSFMLPMLNYANYYFINIVLSLCTFSMVYSSLLAMSQLDMKKMMAYSSMSHMSLVTIGLFLNSAESISGSMYFMISHGFVSTGLFAMMGFLYESFHTSSMFHYNNLSQYMPVLSLMFFIMLLANMSFPLTSGFISELMIIMYLTNVNYMAAMLCMLSTFMTTIYSLWFYAKMNFSNSNNIVLNNLFMKDMNFSEFIILFSLISFIVLLGIFPNMILDSMFMQSYVFSK